MQVVSDESTNDVIAWLPHGKGFQIYKKKKFASDVLPTAFKKTKYTSFSRKLNRWGFTRVTRGPETGAYYHKYFQRGDTRLCMQMSCQTKNSKALAAATAANNNGGDNPQLLQHQLQQLQMHQYHLQQMQMQQHMHAEMMRQQQQNKGDGDDKNKDGDKQQQSEGGAPPPFVPMDQAAYFQSMQAPGGMMPYIPGFQPGVFVPGMPMAGGAHPAMQHQQQQAPTADDGTTTSNEEGAVKAKEDTEATPI